MEAATGKSVLIPRFEIWHFIRCVTVTKFIFDVWALLSKYFWPNLTQILFKNDILMN